MDRVERTRLKQLANDAVIATFGCDSREAKLAVALEQALDHIEYLRAGWRPACDCGLHLMTYDEQEEDELA